MVEANTKCRTLKVLWQLRFVRNLFEFIAKRQAVKADRQGDVVQAPIEVPTKFQTLMSGWQSHKVQTLVEVHAKVQSL